METRERIVDIRPAFDCRDPDPSKNYGIQSCALHMVLKGPEGAVQFILYTGWHLPHVEAELRGDQLYTFLKPMPADVGYHSKEPQYPGQILQTENCPHTDGTCYSDGSTLDAGNVYKILLEKGSEGVWTYLECYYIETFNPEGASE